MKPTHRVILLSRLIRAIAALLIVGGVLITLSAPKPALVNNKADAYGSPAPTKPTNPKTKADCTKYYGTSPSPEARECQALATRYVAIKRCSKKTGASAQKACKKSAAAAFAKARARIAAQVKAEKACIAANTSALGQLKPEDPEFSQKSERLNATLTACLTKARG